MPQSSASAVWSLLGGLALFCLAMVGVWLCLRWLGRHYSGGATGGSIRVLERTPLANDRSLVIVRVKGQVLLLGVTPQHIETLAELNAADYPEEKAGAQPKGAGARGDRQPFSAALQQALQGFTGIRRRGRDNSEQPEQREDPNG